MNQLDYRPAHIKQMPESDKLQLQRM